MLDPIRSVVGRESYPVQAVVRQLRARPGPQVERRLVLAYLNVAQWEEYRVGAAEVPAELLLADDPDGWSGHRQVRYWDERWATRLERAVADLVDWGFDGVFVDWALAYHDASVGEAATDDGVDARAEMAALLRRVDDHGESLRPGFVVVAQNASELVVEERLGDAVDGVTAEPLTFGGRADAAWDDATAADVELPDTANTRRIAELLTAAGDAGFVTLSIDYATRPENVERAQDRSRALGAVPFVSRTPLDRIPPRLVAPR